MPEIKYALNKQLQKLLTILCHHLEADIFTASIKSLIADNYSVSLCSDKGVVIRLHDVARQLLLQIDVQEREIIHAPGSGIAPRYARSDPVRGG